MKERNAIVEEEKRIVFRIGVNLGDIIIDGEDIHGDGVNIAARLQSIALPSGICISDLVHQNLRGAGGGSFEDIGEQNLKNIERKLRVWRWSSEGKTQAVSSANDPAPHGENLLTTIAVLPFEALSSDPDHNFHAEGLTEGVSTAIAKLDTLRLVPANGGEDIERPQYHVKGNVRIAGSRVRCNVHVAEVSSGQRLWAEKYDGDVAEIFDLEDELADQISAALEVELTEGPQVRLWHREAANSLAYRHFSTGRAAYKEYTRSGHARARSEFDAALALSSNFLSAMVSLARVHVEEAVFGWSSDREKGIKEARKLIDGVFAIDPDHALAHMEMAQVLMTEGNFSAARLEGELAVALDPNSADAHHALAHILVCLEMYEAALRSARRAIALNPGRPGFYLVVMAEAFIALKQYSEALAVTEKIIAERPTWIMARIWKALALEGLEKDKEAKSEIFDLLEISPGFTARRWRRYIYFPDRPDVPDLVSRLVSIGLPA
jgi:TolB-like protein/Flp pilus assembly protein TadD